MYTDIVPENCFKEKELENFIKPKEVLEFTKSKPPSSFGINFDLGYNPGNLVKTNLFDSINYDIIYPIIGEDTAAIFVGYYATSYVTTNQTKYYYRSNVGSSSSMKFSNFNNTLFETILNRSANLVESDLPKYLFNKIRFSNQLEIRIEFSKVKYFNGANKFIKAHRKELRDIFQKTYKKGERQDFYHRFLNSLFRKTIYCPYIFFSFNFLIKKIYFIYKKIQCSIVPQKSHQISPFKVDGLKNNYELEK
jgi:hypothetical protein